MTTKTKAVVALVTVAGILTAVPVASAAQEQIGCLRGKPLPDCRSFWVLEMQGLTPLGQTTRTVTWSGGGEPYSYPVEAFSTQVEWNLGHMVNLSNGTAVGGVFTVGSGGPDPLTGLRLRGRKWLTKDLSVELEAGLLRSDLGGSFYGGANGWTSDVRLNIRDQGSFFLRYDGVSVREQTDALGGHSDPGGTHHGLSVGASAGSVPALVGTGALGLAYIVLLAAFWEYD
jgi:hypothetical protein